MAPSRPQFEFVRDETLRLALEADYREMHTCAENDAWKAVHVLAGSIIEAVLVDYLVGEGESTPNPLEMTLAQLIGACRAAGVLSQRTAELSSALKSYRNLIHPGRAMRLNEQADSDGANVAQSLVAIIVREIATTQQEHYGPTAEQIATKFESDPSALGISQHLLKDAKPQELARLLVKVIPSRYFNEAQDEYVDETKLNTYRSLFRSAFEVGDQALKARVVARFVDVLKEESGGLVQVYEEQFFRAPDLEFATEEGRLLIKAHLLAQMKGGITRPLLATAQGIGKWLTNADVEAFVDPLVRAAAQDRDERLAPTARSLLENEAGRTPSKIDPGIIERLDAWRHFFEELGQTREAELAVEMKKAYELFQDIPF